MLLMHMRMAYPFIWASLWFFIRFIPALVLTLWIPFCLDFLKYSCAILLIVAPAKPSGRRTKTGEVSPSPNTKRSKRAGSNRQGSVVTLQTQYHSDAEEVLTVSRDDLSQELECSGQGCN